MAKKEVWQAALAGKDFNEVAAALPLHDPSVGWITATYLDGQTKMVDLRTVLKDATQIVRVELGNSVSTLSLYRLLISIIYDSFDMSVSALEWKQSWKKSLLANEGFDPLWVDSYFDRWEDRFYVLHPTFPFLQDPSLVATYTPRLSYPPSDGEITQYRKTYSQKVEGLSQVHPKAASTNAEGGQKVIWGLPPEEIYSVDSALSERIQMLMTSLLHQRYAHGAVGKGERAFFNQDKGNDSYPAAHSLRCAIGYMVEAHSLYQTLMLAVEYVPSEDLALDIPDWEREVNPETGLLGNTGYNVNYYDLYASPTSPRSSVNFTHLAMLYVPQFDVEKGQQVVDGGQIRQLRRVLFNFKHLTLEDGKTKMPSPLTWNPFIAVKQDGKALKQTSGISDKTALSNPNIFRIAMLPDSEGIAKPKVLLALERDPALDNALMSQGNLNVRIFIFAGEASQEKTYADFTLQTKEMSAIFDNDEMVNRLERWIVAGTDLKEALRKNIKYTPSNQDGKIDVDGPQRAFWANYYALFNSALGNGVVSPLEDYETEITHMVLGIFDAATNAFMSTIPMVVGSKKNFLKYEILKTFSHETSGKETK